MAREPGRFDIHKAGPSPWTRFKAAISSVLVLGAVAGAAYFLASDERLIKVLKDGGALARPAAWGLGYRGCHEAAREPLEQALSRSKGSSDPSVRAACAWALGHARSRDVVPALEDAARRDDSNAVRASAVRALGTNGDGLGLRAIVHAFDDSDALVRVAACEASGDMRDKHFVPYLLDRLHEPLFEIRNAAVKALKETTGQDFDTDESKWRRWWDEHKND